MFIATKPSRQSDISELFTLPLFSFDETRQSDDKNSQIAELDAKKSMIFRRRLECLVSRKPPKGQLFFRGTYIEKLSKDLCKEESNYSGTVSESHFYANLFYFGDKAAFYVEQNKKNALKITKGMLFETLQTQLSKKRQNKRKEVFDFCQKESEIYDFFACNENKSYFCKIISEQDEIFHYYQALSHTLGCIKKFPSRNVSTTRKLDVAIRFAKKKDESSEETGHTPIVLLFAFPEELGEIQFSVKSFHSANNQAQDIDQVLQNNKLPFCKDSYCYGWQKEITIYGALMPHLIWGVYELNNNRIIVNPYMFSPESSLDTLWLKIDQKDFRFRCAKETNFWKYLTYIPGHSMQDRNPFKRTTGLAV